MPLNYVNYLVSGDGMYIYHDGPFAVMFFDEFLKARYPNIKKKLRILRYPMFVIEIIVNKNNKNESCKTFHANYDALNEIIKSGDYIFAYIFITYFPDHKPNYGHACGLYINSLKKKAELFDSGGLKSINFGGRCIREIEKALKPYDIKVNTKISGKDLQYKDKLSLCWWFTTYFFEQKYLNPDVDKFDYNLKEIYEFANFFIENYNYVNLQIEKNYGFSLLKHSFLIEKILKDLHYGNLVKKSYTHLKKIHETYK